MCYTSGRAVPQPAREWVLERAERYIEGFGLAEGEVRDAEAGYLVHFERDLVRPVDEVWTALAGEGNPVAGQTPPLRFTHGYLEPGTVTAVDPPHVLEHAWLRTTEG